MKNEKAQIIKPKKAKTETKIGGGYVYTNSGELYVIKPIYSKDKDRDIIGEERVPIANHTPLLKIMRIVDDGFERTEELVFTVLRNGRTWGNIPVTLKDILSNQPNIKFGGACRIYPNVRGAKACYSDAMQVQCENTKTEILYSHTGWIKTEDGQRVFLNGENSIDKDGLTNQYAVKLEDGLKNFKFFPVEDNTEQCFDTVFSKFVTLIPDNVSIPLLSYSFLSPLNGLLREIGNEPCFSFYIVGKTGSYKSSIAKLIQCFFGAFDYTTPAPLNFEGSENSIEKVLALADGIPLLVDDRKPSTSQAKKIKYEKIESRIAANIGDRAGRTRLNPDGTLKATYIPKSNAIVTAEEAHVNNSMSDIARSVNAEVTNGTIDFDNLVYLQDRSAHFNKVMQLYIQWVINNYGTIQKSAGKLLRNYREVFHNAGHARVATAFSQMMFSYKIALCFAQSLNQMTEEDVSERMKKAKSVFLDMCDSQSRAVESNTPTGVFVELLKELIETHRVRIINLRKAENPTAGISTIGYRDDEFFYLIPDSTYNEVVKFYSEGGNTFPATSQSLWKAFVDEQKAVPEIRNGKVIRCTKRKKIKGLQQNRYVWLRSQVLESEVAEDGE